MAHIEEGRKVMEEVIQELADFGKVESPPAQHSRRIICTISPK
jgi:translation initiation factor IF-3